MINRELGMFGGKTKDSGRQRWMTGILRYVGMVGAGGNGLEGVGRSDQKVVKL